MASVPRLPYPSCGKGPLPKGELIGSGHLRPGPTYNQEDQVTERFEIRKRGCLYFVTDRQEWVLDTSDFEAIYDDHMRPLRVWKRQVLPTEPHAIEHADIRLYELRQTPPTLTWRTRKGKMQYRILKGGRPQVLVGPGIGILSMWIRKAHLKQGQTSKLPVLDFRKEIETVERRTLHRENDQYVPDLGRRVQVYTLYGNESVFADDNGIVIGDLRGMRPWDAVKGPAPKPIPRLAPDDPVHTP